MVRVVAWLAKLIVLPFAVVGAGLLLGAGLAPTAGVAASVVDFVEDEVMDFPPLPDDLRELAERTVITDRFGDRLAFVREEDRRIIALDEIPLHVRQAVLATEDQAFYEHEGVSWVGIVRALVGNVQAGEITAGGSTITQQLVKNLVLDTNEQTLDRKLQEAVYATDLETRMSKDDILESYLNSSSFGNRTFGVAAAAEFYWGKPVADLTVAEGALLAGLLRAPEANEPIDNPENAETRRTIVLEQMAQMGAITSEEAEAHAAEPMDLDARVRDDAAEDYVITYLLEELKDIPVLGDDPERAFQRLATGGLEIRTTIHPQLQTDADEAIRAHLEATEDPLAATATVDPRTGELLAFAFGPADFGPGEGQVDVNPAVPGLGSPGRQSGSSFKAFELVAALEDGLSPGFTMDTPSPYEPEAACSDTEWEPDNFADSGGGVMDMARATAVSSNIYFAYLVDQVTGPERLAETAQRMGIDKELRGNCAAVLGTDDVHMLDMASAFGTLANRGVHCAPFVIAEVIDRDGNVIYADEGACARAVDEGIAARATSILTGPVASGTAALNGQIGRPAAGKTGTTQNYRDAWFVGFIPQLSTAVWVGNERGEASLTAPDCPEGMTGGCTPTSIWSTFMRAATDHLELEVEDFAEPPPLPTSTVPDVVGQPVEEAEDVMIDADFRPVTEEVADFRPPGTVLRHDPAGGARASTGSAVRLSISDGTGEQPRIPDLAGLPLDDARTSLASLGLDLTLEAVEVPVDDIGLLGAVVGQAPAAGTPAEQGATVTVDVGRQRGPEDQVDPSPDASDPATDPPSPAPPGPAPPGPDPSPGPPEPSPGPPAPTPSPSEAPQP